MGKLIVIEGLDGSGKTTQLGIAVKRLKDAGVNIKEISFPNYGAPACGPVEEYLAGEYGKDPKSVNQYAASTFYAVDRYASFKKNWGKFYNDGGIVITARYTGSNAIHQGSKIVDPDSKEHTYELRSEFFRWLAELEFNLMGIPAPDLVVYLDVDVKQTEKNMRNREKETNTKADIHETDESYIEQCKKSAADAAQFYGWVVIPCTDDNGMRSIEDINNDILKVIKDKLNIG